MVQSEFHNRPAYVVDYLTHASAFWVSTFGVLGARLITEIIILSVWCKTSSGARGDPSGSNSHSALLLCKGFAFSSRAKVFINPACLWIFKLLQTADWSGGVSRTPQGLRHNEGFPWKLTLQLQGPYISSRHGGLQWQSSRPLPTPQITVHINTLWINGGLSLPRTPDNSAAGKGKLIFPPLVRVWGLLGPSQWHAPGAGGESEG